MDRFMEFQQHEREARRLRAEYAGDSMVRAVVALDLAIRRVADRVLSLFDADGSRVPRAGSAQKHTWPVSR